MESPEFHIFEPGHLEPDITIQAGLCADPVVLTDLLSLRDDTETPDHSRGHALSVQDTFEKRDVMDDPATDVMNLESSRDPLHKVIHLRETELVLLTDKKMRAYHTMEDPILTRNTARFTSFPIRYPDLWALYKKAIGSFWTVEEIDLAADLKDWNNLSDSERHFIKTVLAFFAASDGIVMENIDLNFSRDVQIAEARSFYAYQSFNESIHSETYSLMIEKLVKDPVEKSELFRAIETVPAIKQKAEWARTWIASDAPFAQRLAAFACVEGIFFSGSFCAIFWLKKRGLMPGLSFSNELISRDEGLHQEFAVTLHSHLKEKCPSKDIHKIVQSAVEIESQFITEALPCKLIGMDPREMTQYIQFVADRLMAQFGEQPIYGAKNPFDWMETISLEGKTNFFEKRVGDYSKHLATDGDSIRFDEEF